MLLTLPFLILQLFLALLPLSVREKNYIILYYIILYYIILYYIILYYIILYYIVLYYIVLYYIILYYIILYYIILYYIILYYIILYYIIYHNIIFVSNVPFTQLLFDLKSTRVHTYTKRCTLCQTHSPFFFTFPSITVLLTPSSAVNSSILASSSSPES